MILPVRADSKHLRMNRDVRAPSCAVTGGVDAAQALLDLIDRTKSFLLDLRHAKVLYPNQI